MGETGQVMAQQIHRRENPMEQVLQRLSAIEVKLDDLKEDVQNINGSVRAHGDWISRREPMCSMTCTKIDELTTKVDSLENHFDWRYQKIEQKLWKLSGVVALVIGGITFFSDHLQWFVHLIKGIK